MNIKPAYQYTVKKFIKIIDGDTVDISIDLGFNICIEKRVRLYGIDTPETRTRDLDEKKRGFAAKDRLQVIINENIDKGIPIIIKCHGIGKFGRNNQLVVEGFAEEYK